MNETKRNNELPEIQLASLESMKEHIESFRKAEKAKQEEIKEIRAGRRTGRPNMYQHYDIPPRIMEGILTAFDNGETKVEVAVKFGITSQTIRNWRKKDPIFNESFMLGFERGKGVRLKQAWDVAVGLRDGNASVLKMMFVNEYRFRERIKEEQRNENTKEAEMLEAMKEIRDQVKKEYERPH